MMVDPEDLIDSAQVAQMLGLSKRNSVLTYRNRYPSFPQPVVDRPRAKLWRRQDVESWRHSTLRAPEGDGQARAQLLEAARTLLSERPASEVSVRDIATVAGVPHTVLYRHFTGKEDLRQAVVAQTVARVRAAVPLNTSARDAVLTTVAASLEHARDFRILAFSLLAGDSPTQFEGLPVMSALLTALQATESDDGLISDEQCVALLAALVLGWGTFEDRIRSATGVEGSVSHALEQVVIATLRLAGHES
jgi:glutathione-regulated potassium-efflux system ancillary protein KefG